jgi:hypothetical protein
MRTGLPLASAPKVVVRLAFAWLAPPEAWRPEPLVQGRPSRARS